jgi:hypothetical protein
MTKRKRTNNDLENITTLPEQFENPIEKISHANRGKIRPYQYNQDAP